MKTLGIVGLAVALFALAAVLPSLGSAAGSPTPVASIAAESTAVPGTPQPTPGAAQPSTISLSVSVVYDVNNDGRLDPEDRPLAGQKFIIDPIVGHASSPRLESATQPDGAPGIADAAAGTYKLVAIGPAYLPEDVGKKDAICRGWRTSFIDGVSLASAVSQPADGLGFTVDFVAPADAKPLAVTIGVSDKGAPGTQWEGAQIYCPETGSGVPSSLPPTGDATSGARQNELLLVTLGGFLLLVVGSAGLYLRRRTTRG